MRIMGELLFGTGGGGDDCIRFVPPVTTKKMVKRERKGEDGIG